MTEPHGVLVVTCPDGPGIVAAVAGLLARTGANIVEAQQHSEGERFFFRVEFEPNGVKPSVLESGFSSIAEQYEMDWRLRYSDRLPRFGIVVSKFEHCLVDLLWRGQAGELQAEFPVVISNHDTLRQTVERFDIPFHHIPVTPATKQDAETRQVALLKDAGCHYVVMARYMQVLTPTFLSGFPLKVINVHHGLLPSFTGAKPYDQAWDRGVKVVGATAHYATEVLDDGPIIDQEVVFATHRDTVADLIRKGRDAERLVLARAVRAQAEDRVLVHGRRTVVFS